MAARVRDGAVQRWLPNCAKRLSLSPCRAVALQGDLKTYPLIDLLQWLDASRKPGQVAISVGEGERRMVLAPGIVSRSGVTGLHERFGRLGALLGIEAKPGPRRDRAELPEAFVQELAREDLLSSVADLVRESSGVFHYWDELEQEQDELLTVDVPIREVLYESLRRVDEGQSALKTVKTDTASLSTAKEPGPELGILPRVALRVAEKGTTVGAVRLALGLSLPEAARMLQELWRAGYVAFDGGALPRPDPLTRMLRQGEQLVGQGQYEAAELLFNSLLATDPSDRRVRGFLRVVEREHTEVLYRKLRPTSVPALLVQQSSLAALRPDERIVATLLNGKWDVSTLVLASPLRELQTLRAIDRMVSMGFVEL